ncbi:MAG: homoserine kinase [Ruminococcaceae bacterium]|nr:homoserine kinase [Oscillospiraceae bacterium]
MFKIRVPATSANMGPCFDTAGLAVNIYNEVEVYTEEDGIEDMPLVTSNCLVDPRVSANQRIPLDEENLIIWTMNHFAEVTGATLPKFVLKQHDRIPLTRGLGSSAACIVAGLLAANELTGNKVSREYLMNIAVECEGHPDNVAPAFKGGMVVGASEGKRFEYVKIDVSDKLEFLALIPDFPLSTADARAVLPRAYTKEQSVFNCSRVALLVASMMSGNFKALSIAMQDEIHQPYRKILIPGMEAILKASAEFGSYGGYLSGAGPTLMLVNPAGSNVEDKIRNFVSQFEHFWLVQPVKVDNEGAVIIK